jgi:hypothetical protein
MRILIVALMIVSLTLPAYAQMGGMGGGGMGAGGMGGGKGGRKGAAKATSDPNAAKKNPPTPRLAVAAPHEPEGSRESHPPKQSPQTVPRRP